VEDLQQLETETSKVCRRSKFSKEEGSLAFEHQAGILAASESSRIDVVRPPNFLRKDSSIFLPVTGGLTDITRNGVGFS